MATQQHSHKKQSPKKTGKIILFSVEIIILALLAVGLWLVLKATGTTDTDGQNTGVQKININEEDIMVNVAEEVKENETMKGYRNIALFGVDSRTGALTQKTRTDTIMIASVNLETKEVKLVSVYRDTYLNQMGSSESYGKCNAAYAYGGAEQAINMLNSNLDMDITDFVTIGFEGLKDVIDALGGVYVDVDETEIEHLNNYQLSMKETLGLSSITPVQETGYQLLNGLQATAYCRIRYTAGNDFKRTERQREVLQATLDVAKTLSINELTKICNNVFSEVYTSLDLSEILELLASITEYTVIDEGGFPESTMITTGTIGSKGSCVIPLDLESNVVWLHEFLFEEEGYTPSSKVTEYSQKVYKDTNPYLTGAVSNAVSEETQTEETQKGDTSEISDTGSDTGAENTVTE